MKKPSKPNFIEMPRSFARFFKITATDRKAMAAIIAMFLVGVALAPVAPLFIAKLIDVLISPPANAFWLSALFIISAAVMSFGAGAIEALGYFYAEIYAQKRFREIAARIVPMIADPNRDEREKADIRTAFTDLQDTMYDVIIITFEFIVTLSVKIAVMSVILTIILGVKYTVIMLAASFGIVGASVLNFVTLNRLQRTRAATNYRLQEHTSKLVENHELIALFQRQDYETNRFGRFAARIVKVNIKYFKTFFRYGATREFSTELVIAILTLVIAIDIIAGHVGVEAIFLFLAYATALIADVQGAPRLVLHGYEKLVRIEPILRAIEGETTPAQSARAHRDIECMTVANVKIPYLPDFPSDKVFTFERGHIYWIDGANGAGKTSFLRGIVGVEPDIECDVFVNVNARKVGPLTRAQRLATMGYASQTERIWARSVAENIKYSHAPSDNRAINPDAPIPKNIALDKNAQHLSGGQRQLVHTLRALEKDVDIIILDEPTNALDGERIKELTKYLLKLAHDKIIIFASHDREFQNIATDQVVLTAEPNSPSRREAITPSDLHAG